MVLNPLALNVFSDIWSGIKDLFSLFANFFESIGSFLSFIGNTIVDWFKFGGLISSAVSSLPKVFEFLPDLLIPFASGALLISIILLFLGRNK